MHTFELVSINILIGKESVKMRLKSKEWQAVVVIIYDIDNLSDSSFAFTGGNYSLGGVDSIFDMKILEVFKSSFNSFNGID